MASDMIRRLGTQPRPEDDARFVEHAFHFGKQAAKGGNVVIILAMLAGMLHEAERFGPVAVIVVVSNTFALLVTSHFLPRAERRHGVLYAHRLFCVVNMANMVLFYAIVIPALIWTQGYIGESRSLGMGSPLLLATCSALYGMMTVVLHLTVFPLGYRCVVHASFLTVLLHSPSYTVLGRTQELIFCLFGLAFGELAGGALQRIFRLSFEAASAANARLKSQLAQIDKEKELMASRLEQLDAEKERLTYELLIEQSQHARAVSQGPSAAGESAAMRGGRRQASSVGTNSELGDLLGACSTDDALTPAVATGRDASSIAARLKPTSPSAASDAASTGSDDDDEGDPQHIHAHVDAIGLSTSLNHRLDATLHGLGMTVG